MKKVYRVQVEGGLEGLSFPDLIIKQANGVEKVVVVKKGELLPTAQIDDDMLNRSLSIGCLGRAIQKGWVIEENLEESKPQEEIIFSNPEARMVEIEPGSYVSTTVIPQVVQEIEEEKKTDPKYSEDTDKYHCPKCGRNHLISSKIGKNHMIYLKEIDSDTSDVTIKEVNNTPKLTIVQKNSEDTQGENLNKELKAPVNVEKPKVSEKIDESLEPSAVDTYEKFNKLGLFAKLQFIQNSPNIDIIKEIHEKSESKQIKNNARLRLLQEREL